MAAIDSRFRDHPEVIPETFWHLDNAGAVLLSFRDINPNYNSNDELNAPCKCTPEEGARCGFNIVPVPPGWQVILQR